MLVALIFAFVSVSYAADAAAPAATPAAPAAAKKKPKKPLKYKAGAAVKDFKLKDGITKAEISFENDIKGKAKVTALTFMTTACSACQAEIKLLSDLADKYGDDLAVWSVIVDVNGEKTVPAYDEKYGLNVRYLLDPDFSIPNKFGFTYTPSLAIMDKTGKVIYLKGGYSPNLDPENIIKAVKDALN